MKRFRSLRENGSYKLVAIIVALVLWSTMQGRRDTVLNREMEMQVLLPPTFVITNPIPQTVRIEVSGPRVALKKLAERTEPITVDLGKAKPGRQLVKLHQDQLNLPVGAKVLSIQPDEFIVVIGETEGSIDVKNKGR
jgi:YbbR domain-containing protein